MLDRWVRELAEADAVVGYDAAFPANPASPRTGGWFYASRRKGVDKGLIRESDTAVASKPRRKTAS